MTVLKNRYTTVAYITQQSSHSTRIVIMINVSIPCLIKWLCTNCALTILVKHHPVKFKLSNSVLPDVFRKFPIRSTDVTKHMSSKKLLELNSTMNALQYASISRV